MPVLLVLTALGNRFISWIRWLLQFAKPFREKEIGRLRDVLQKLIEAGNAAIKGDYSDWDFVVPEAEALLTTTGEE